MNQRFYCNIYMSCHWIECNFIAQLRVRRKKIKLYSSIFRNKTHHMREWVGATWWKIAWLLNIQIWTFDLNIKSGKSFTCCNFHRKIKKAIKLFRMFIALNEKCWNQSKSNMTDIHSFNEIECHSKKYADFTRLVVHIYLLNDVFFSFLLILLSVCLLWVQLHFSVACDSYHLKHSIWSERERKRKKNTPTTKADTIFFIPVAIAKMKQARKKKLMR